VPRYQPGGGSPLSAAPRRRPDSRGDPGRPAGRSWGYRM